jgi:hypothetical protein
MSTTRKCTTDYVEGDPRLHANLRDNHNFMCDPSPDRHFFSMIPFSFVMRHPISQLVSHQVSVGVRMVSSLY